MPLTHTEFIKMCERVGKTVNDKDKRIAELEAALRQIADGRGICGTCGTPAVGEGEGYTACDCAHPVWTPQDPRQIARKSLVTENG